MSAGEIRASLALAGIFALRMLGLFLILPVFSEHAKTLPGGDNAAIVGLALGIYGLMQACLHIPLGMLSDRIGRKPVIAGGLLLFVLGGAVAASATDLTMIAIGRAIQGTGAVSAAITALLADLTREQHRTKAMAMVGGSIALTFAVSMVVASPLYHAISLSGMFWLMTGLGVLALGVTWFGVPTPPAAVQVARVPFKAVLLQADLVRLNVGVLALHACQVAMFMIVPRLLSEAGIGLESHWRIYLPVVLLSFVLMLAPMMAAERYGRIRVVLLSSVALMLAVQLMFAELSQLAGTHVWAIAAVLLLFFTAFNILEAMQPSLVSRYAAQAKGTALGVYNTTQAIGLFLGGAGGGWLLKHGSRSSVFLACAGLLGVWLIIAWNMRELPRRGAAAINKASAVSA